MLSHNAGLLLWPRPSWSFNNSSDEYKSVHPAPLPPNIPTTQVSYYQSRLLQKVCHSRARSMFSSPCLLRHQDLLINELDQHHLATCSHWQWEKKMCLLCLCPTDERSSWLLDSLTNLHSQTVNVHHSPQRQYQKSRALRLFISAACQRIVDLHQVIEPTFVASAASAASVACPPLSFFACSITRWRPKLGWWVLTLDDTFVEPTWHGRSLSCAFYHPPYSSIEKFVVYPYRIFHTKVILLRYYHYQKFTAVIASDHPEAGITNITGFHCMPGDYPHYLCYWKYGYWFWPYIRGVYVTLL